MDVGRLGIISLQQNISPSMCARAIMNAALLGKLAEQIHLLRYKEVVLYVTAARAA